MSDDFPSTRFRDLTNIALELFIATLTLLPFLVLIYSYSSLPERIPEDLNQHSDVSLGPQKSLFRLSPGTNGLDLQLLTTYVFANADFLK
jgi:hypothetical protein